MSCEICERSFCEAHQEIVGRINKLKGHYHGDNYYIKLDEVLEIIESL